MDFGDKEEFDNALPENLSYLCIERIFPKKASSRNTVKGSL